MKYLNEIEENMKDKALTIIYSEKSKYQEIINREIDDREDYDAIDRVVSLTKSELLNRYNLDGAIHQPDVYIADIVDSKIDENKIIEQVQKELNIEAEIGL